MAKSIVNLMWEASVLVYVRYRQMMCMSLEFMKGIVAPMMTGISRKSCHRQLVFNQQACLHADARTGDINQLKTTHYVGFRKTDNSRNH